MNNYKITELLPQKYPFLYIDKVLEFEKDKKLIALKNVTINEHFFQGHFSGQPVMPGVLLIEVMGQAGMIFMNFNSNKYNTNKKKQPELFYLCSVKAKFFRQVTPGDRVIIEVYPVKLIKDSGIIKTIAKVDDTIVAKAEMTGSKRK